MGPADVTENSGLDVGPHPHIRLQTVTWLTDGQVLHLDCLGTEQVIKPGQLNLITAGSELQGSALPASGQQVAPVKSPENSPSPLSSR